MRKYLFVLIYLLCVKQISFAVTYGGETPIGILQASMGSRISALGGSSTSIDDDYAVWSNPAVIAFNEKNKIALTHSMYFEDVKQDIIGGNGQYKGVNFSIWGNYLNYGSINQTTYSSGGNPIGTATANENIILLNSGKRLNDNISIGFNLKFIKSEMYKYASRTVGCDFGFLLRWEDEIYAGFSIQNIGVKQKFISKEEAEPLAVRVGFGSKPVEYLLTSFDIVKYVNADLEISGGIEYSINKNLDLRTGFNSSREVGPGFTLGLGLNYNKFELDYAFIPFGDLGNINILSVSYKLKN